MTTEIGKEINLNTVLQYTYLKQLLAELQKTDGYNLLSISTTVILAVAGFNVTAESFDIKDRMKYSKSSTVRSLRTATITVCVGEEALNVRLMAISGKSMPAID